MLIYKHNIPDKLIIEYCKIIIGLKKNFDSDLEYMRKQLHDKIFESARCDRSLYRREDRLFNTALNRIVSDLTYVDYDLPTIVLNKSVTGLIKKE